MSQRPSDALTKEQLLELYYFMRLGRELENRLVRLYRQGKIVGGVYTGIGNEATAVGSVYALDRRQGDIFAPMHRDMGARRAWGQPPVEVLRNYLGRADGPSRGRDGNVHYGAKAMNLFGMISHLGAMIPVTAGAVLASRMQGKDAIGLTYIGDGGSSQGDFHEGLNFAAVHKIGLVLIIENNQWAYSTPTRLQYACERLVDRAAGYGIPGELVDGTDVLAVYDAARRAVDRARAGQGPSLIECVSMRMHGHAEHDDASYVPREQLQEWAKKDPIEQFERVLAQRGLGGEVPRLIERIGRELDQATALAERSPLPKGPEVLEGVYAP